MLLFSGCKTPERKPEPKPVPERVPEKPKRQSFVPPTAEQAYRLQDDCTRRGDWVLKNNAIGLALSQEQVSRYNLTMNRCYVRAEIHAKKPDEFGKYDYSTYLFDGQTAELLAYYIYKPDGGRAYLGFGCPDVGCIEEKVSACMNGKDCDPQ